LIPTPHKHSFITIQRGLKSAPLAQWAQLVQLVLLALLVLKVLRAQLDPQV
jgi:hypothetical protein